MEITNETHTMHIVNHLKDTLANHDWYYQMAEGDAYYEGLKVASEINYLKNVLIARGYERQVETILDRYRPEMPNVFRKVPRVELNSYDRAELNILTDWRLHGYPTLQEDSSFVDRLLALGYSVEDTVNLMAEYEVNYEQWRNS